MDGGPWGWVVIFLELFNKVLVFNLFEVWDLGVVHNCELGLVGGHGPWVSGIWVVGAANPEVFVQEERQGFDGLH